MKPRLNCLIDGTVAPSRNMKAATLADGTHVEFQVTTSEELDLALDVIRTGQPVDVASSAQIERVLLEIDRNFLTLSKWFSYETGYLLKDAMAMVGAAKVFCSDLCRGATDRGPHIAMPFSSYNSAYNRSATLRNLPRGRLAVVLAANSPWPLAVVYALAANQMRCPVLILPSSRTPLSALSAARCIQALGEGSGISILNAITREALAAGYSKRCFDAVHFVGSSKWYADIASDCARNGLSLTYEGEGNCVAIVDAPEADVDIIARTLFTAATRCNGQLCSTVSGVLCTDSCYDALREKLTELFSEVVPSLSLEDGDLGPLLGPVDELNESLDLAANMGATILVGGKGKKRLMPATLVEIDETQWQFATSENFGPVAWIRKLSALEDAVELLDDIGSGLTISVFGRTADKIVDLVSSRARFARICINCDPTIQSLNHPWGNYGKSGMSESKTFFEKCMLPVAIESSERDGEVLRSSCVEMTAIGKVRNSTYNVSISGLDLVVENLYSGVCGTDREVYRGNLEAAFPFIPGHENVGKVRSAPTNRLCADGIAINAGDVVAWNPLIPCGKCKVCLEGSDNLCPHLRVFGLGMTSEVSPHLLGGWSRFAIVPPEARVHKLNKFDTPELGIFADPTATGIRCYGLAGKTKGDWLVVGAGALGSTIAVTLHCLNAGNVWAAGNMEQLEMLETICSERAIVISREDALTSSKLLENGLRPDFVVDTICSKDSIDACLHAANAGATIFLAGGLAPRTLPFESGKLTKGEISIRGVLGYSSRQFAEAVQVIGENPRAYARLAIKRVALSDAVAQAFSASRRKVVIECQE
ncbi:MAG: aldehyde dehydrogenase family protein [Pseudomonadota bacterium]